MQKIRIDFDNPGLPQHISAVENDSQSRFFQATLYENGKAYTAPEGATYSIMYRGFGPQNQGWYDTINDGAGKRAACTASGNVVTCEIARQALQVPGHVSIVLCVTTGKGYMLKSWPIECDCKNDRYDSTAEIQSFFYITQVSNADWNRIIQALEDLKNTIDPTLSLSGKAADAAKVGEAVNAEVTRAKAAEETNARGIGQLKEDIKNEQKYSAETIISVDIPMERGSISGDGSDFDSAVAFRSNWTKFDDITYIFVDQSKSGSFITNVYKKDKLGTIKVIGGNSRILNRYIITDTESEYRMMIKKSDNSDFTKDELKSILNVLSNKKSIYRNLEGSAYSVSLFWGVGDIVDSETLSLSASRRLCLLNLISPDKSGYVQITNPNGYSFIVYTTNSSFDRMFRDVYKEKEFYFSVSNKYLYWISLYRNDGVYDASGITALYKETLPEESELRLVWESGAMNGGGEQVPNNTRLVSQKIKTKNDTLYVFTFPDKLNATVNIYDSVAGIRKNSSLYFTAPFSIKGQNDFIRFSVKYIDDSEITTSNAKSLLEEIHLYKIKTTNNLYDVIVSASDSTESGDIKCNGSNDQEILQALLCCNESIKILLNGGTYTLNKLYTTHKSNQKSALFTNDIFTNYKNIVLNGKRETRAADLNATKISCKFEIPSSGENSAILVPRQNVALDTKAATNVVVDIDAITILGNGYTNPITYLDCTSANAAQISNVMVRADGSTSGLQTLDTRPNRECVGIRAGYGSNNGIQNYIKHCMCIYCGKGYSVCGEHYILEDNLAHHCLIGFAFGDKLTRGNYEHPNIMIGCSVEGSYRLMELSKYGATEESEQSYASNTLICIGLSTETVWKIPLDELVDGQETTSRTLPIKEIIHGAYRGKIELDYPVNPFDNNSGKNMKYIRYSTDGITEGTGTN